jgi:WD40 repeat protein
VHLKHNKIPRCHLSEAVISEDSHIALVILKWRTGDGHFLLPMIDIDVWDLCGGKLIKRIRAIGDNPIALSPNNHYALVTIDTKKLGLYNLSSGLEIKKLILPPKNVTDLTYFTLAFSPDSRWAAVGMNDKGVCLFDLTQDQEVLKTYRTLQVGYDKRSVHNDICAVAFSYDGKYALIGSNSDKADKAYVCLWDLKADKLIKISQFVHGMAQSIQSSCDGKFALIGSFDLSLWNSTCDLRYNLPEIFTWPTPFVEIEEVLEPCDDQIKSVAFNADAQCAVAMSDDGRIGIFPLMHDVIKNLTLLEILSIIKLYQGHDCTNLYLELNKSSEQVKAAIKSYFNR